MKIRALPVWTIQAILNVYSSWSSLRSWNRTCQVHFAPCSGRMRSLCKLCLLRIYKKAFDKSSRTSDMRSVSARSFLQTKLLQNLSMNGISFLRDYMKQVRRYLNDLAGDSPHPHSLPSLTKCLDFPWCHSPSDKTSDHGRNQVISLISQVSLGPARERSTLCGAWK